MILTESVINSARLIEELSLNAWPALQTIHYDGWLLRFADGYTQRANSIHAIYPPSTDSEQVDSNESAEDKFREKTRQSEEIYKRRGQKTIFKISPAVRPITLDTLLAAQGYDLKSITSVQTTDLAGWIMTAPLENVKHEMVLSQRWLDLYCRLANINASHVATLKQMLNNIVPLHCFVTVLHNQKPVAVGLVVVERGYGGLYMIVTDETYRRRGFGSYILRQLLFWAVTHSADRAYLHVATDNEPALRLYRAFGFAEIYRYWYRVKSDHAPTVALL